MNVTLAQGENLIKSWDYGTEKKLIGFKKHFNLTLTDKRLISVEETRHGVTRSDYDIKSISGVETSYDKKRNIILSALLILIGIVVLIVLAVSNMVLMGVIIGLVCILLGVLILILSFIMKLSVIIYGNGIPIAAVSANASLRLRKIKFRKIKVDRQAGEEIASTLGAYLLVLLNK